MDQDHVVVNLKISNRTFKLKVLTKDEAKVRNKAQACNDQIDEFKKAFPGRDIQDYLSMFIIQMMDESQANSSTIDQKEIIEGLTELNALFENK